MPWLDIKSARELSQYGIQNLQLALHKSTMGEFDSGMDWYELAKESIEVMRKYHFPWYSASQVTGIVAILSPNLHWESNIQAMKEFMVSQRVLATKQATSAAKKWLQDQYQFNFKTGPKISNFYHNLMDPKDPNYVTIDRHAIRAWLGPIHARRFDDDHGRIGLNHKSYQIIAEHYKEVASHYDILPNQLQAICWQVARRQFGGRQYDKS